MQENENRHIKKKLLATITAVVAVDNTEQLLSDAEGIRKVLTNSLNLVKLLVAIENEFNIEIPDEDIKLDLFTSLDKVTNYLQTRIEADHFTEGIQ